MTKLAERHVHQVLKQFDDEDAFWFVSIISKIKNHGLSIEEVYKIFKEERPDVLEEWNEYVKET